ncbi:DNA-binding response regulator [Streptomyces sp. SID3915]|uniref:DNA-binding response regulator n=1 Tax=Streptomyces sp. SID3915 TaxID=2690263 RepID=UPI001418E0AA|nr:DNA-binding response regulator [Streptomyces sp. SID3915]MYX71086.1 DNA-binding response regulator [Streptomyces sp. SID3915]
MLSTAGRHCESVAACCQTGGVRNEQVFSVRGDAELVARAGHFFTSTRTEFVCAARDLRTWAQPEARGAVQNRMHASGPPGFAVRKLFSPLALADEADRAHLRAVRGQGVLVRISGSALPHETIIIDRRVMILAGQDSATGREYTVTTSQTLVDGVHSLFSAIWDTAVDPDTYLRENVPHLDADGRAILQALGSGLTDASAAGRLGLSVRTYRRRVAELMAALDAASRFQAGLRAGELGLPR